MQYEKMTIDQLEKAVREALSTSKNAIIEATKILRYLQKTNRYKENVRYAKEPFKVYLEDQFGVREGTYTEWVRALPFEKEARAYGIGLVSKTMRICGAAGAKRVFTEVKAMDEKQGKIVSREKIDEIITKHQDPKRLANIKKEYTDWRAMYQQAQAVIVAKDERIKILEAENAELKEQIEKLKDTAETFTEIRTIFDKHYEHRLTA
jgi:hypothetical protein